MKKLFTTTLMLSASLLTFTSLSISASTTLSSDDASCGYELIGYHYTPVQGAPGVYVYRATQTCTNLNKVFINYPSNSFNEDQISYWGGAYNP